MTDPFDRSSTPHGDGMPKPAASLSEVKIRRRGRDEDVDRNAKPGNLTSILAERRQDTDKAEKADGESKPRTEMATTDNAATTEEQTAKATKAEAVTEDAAPSPPQGDSAPPPEPDADDRGPDHAPGPNGTHPANGNVAGNGHLSQPPKISAASDAPDTAAAREDDDRVEDQGPEIGGETPSAAPKTASPPSPTGAPARTKSKTLRERLKAQRSPRRETPAKPQPPKATSADPQSPKAQQEDRPTSDAAGDPTGAPADDAGEAAAAMKTGAPAPPPPQATNEATKDDAPATATDGGDGGGGSIRERMARRRDAAKDDSESAADVVTDALLRKRMAAVLLSETKRREEREAKQDEKVQSDAGTEEPAPEAEAIAAPQSPKWSPPPAKPVDIVRYWTLARRGRRLPALSDLDLDEIARNWPDSLLLRYVPESRHLELEKSLVRLSKTDSDQPDARGAQIDYTPDVIDWVVHQGLVVTKDGNPVRATDEFDVEDGIARYRVVALPLGEDGSDIDHILCHLEPA